MKDTKTRFSYKEKGVNGDFSVTSQVIKRLIGHNPMLKKIIFLCCGLVCAATSAYSQVGEQRNQWALGFNGGVSINKILFTPNIRQFYQTAPVLGFTARYTNEKYYGLICAIQLEANYWRAGWREEILSSTSHPLPDTYQRNIDYIQLPMMANLGLGEENRGFKGFLLAGPQVSYAFGDREVRSTQWTTYTSKGVTLPNRANGVIAQYGKSIENHLDYGIVGGLGAEVSSKIGHFIVDARYYYGLSDIFHNAKKDPFARSANNALMFKFTYLMDFPRDKRR